MACAAAVVDLQLAACADAFVETHPRFLCFPLQVPDDVLVERVVGRRLDPETGDIYHLTFKPPPAEIAGRLTQRSDDTEDALRSRLAVHHANVAAVSGYYSDCLVPIDGLGSMEDVFGRVQAALRAVAVGGEGGDDTLAAAA